MEPAAWEVTPSPVFVFRSGGGAYGLDTIKGKCGVVAYIKSESKTSIGYWGNLSFNLYQAAAKLKTLF